ncbi:MAG: alpha/beta hydrolase domain-containing protein, partial [Burkholderiales bacterium]
PLQRALFVALDEWVDGKAPPPSRMPRLADGTLTTPDKVGFPAIPGIQVARRMNEIGVIRDWTKPEIDMKKPYRPLVPQVDADGNEVAGIRAAELRVPVATFMGWNPRHAENGAPGDIMLMMGSTLPFARTREERDRSGDPRPSVAERYASKAAYLDRVREATRTLIEMRHVLAEDLEAIVERAGERWDWVQSLQSGPQA